DHLTRARESAVEQLAQLAPELDVPPHPALVVHEALEDLAAAESAAHQAASGGAIDPDAIDPDAIDPDAARQRLTDAAARVREVQDQYANTALPPGMSLQPYVYDEVSHTEAVARRRQVERDLLAVAPKGQSSWRDVADVLSRLGGIHRALGDEVDDRGRRIAELRRLVDRSGTTDDGDGDGGAGGTSTASTPADRPEDRSATPPVVAVSRVLEMLANVADAWWLAAPGSPERDRLAERKDDLLADLADLASELPPGLATPTPYVWQQPEHRDALRWRDVLAAAVDGSAPPEPGTPAASDLERLARRLGALDDLVARFEAADDRRRALLSPQAGIPADLTDGIPEAPTPDDLAVLTNHLFDDATTLPVSAQDRVADALDHAGLGTPVPGLRSSVNALDECDACLNAAFTAAMGRRFGSAEADGPAGTAPAVAMSSRSWDGTPAAQDGRSTTRWTDLWRLLQRLPLVFTAGADPTGRTDPLDAAKEAVRQAARPGRPAEAMLKTSYPGAADALPSHTVLVFSDDGETVTLRDAQTGVDLGDDAVRTGAAHVHARGPLPADRLRDLPPQELQIELLFAHDEDGAALAPLPDHVVQGYAGPAGAGTGTGTGTTVHFHRSEQPRLDALGVTYDRPADDSAYVAVTYDVPFTTPVGGDRRVWVEYDPDDSSRATIVPQRAGDRGDLSYTGHRSLGSGEPAVADDSTGRPNDALTRPDDEPSLGFSGDGEAGRSPEGSPIWVGVDSEEAIHDFVAARVPLPPGIEPRWMVRGVDRSDVVVGVRDASDELVAVATARVVRREDDEPSAQLGQVFVAPEHVGSETEVELIRAVDAALARSGVHPSRLDLDRYAVEPARVQPGLSRWLMQVFLYNALMQTVTLPPLVPLTPAVARWVTDTVGASGFFDRSRSGEVASPLGAGLRHSGFVPVLAVDEWTTFPAPEVNPGRSKEWLAAYASMLRENGFDSDPRYHWLPELLLGNRGLSTRRLLDRLTVEQMASGAWDGADLSGLTFSAAESSRHLPVLLRDVSLKDVDLAATTWLGWRFGGMDLTGADFAGATIVKGDLRGANLDGARFDVGRITDTRLDWATLRPARFDAGRFADRFPSLRIAADAPDLGRRTGDWLEVLVRVLAGAGRIATAAPHRLTVEVGRDHQVVTGEVLTLADGDTTLTVGLDGDHEHGVAWVRGPDGSRTALPDLPDDVARAVVPDGADLLTVVDVAAVDEVELPGDDESLGYTHDGGLSSPGPAEAVTRLVLDAGRHGEDVVEVEVRGLGVVPVRFGPADGDSVLALTRWLANLPGGPPPVRVNVPGRVSLGSWGHRVSVAEGAGLQTIGGYHFAVQVPLMVSPEGVVYEAVIAPAWLAAKTYGDGTTRFEVPERDDDRLRSGWEVVAHREDAASSLQRGGFRSLAPGVWTRAGVVALTDADGRLAAVATRPSPRLGRVWVDRVGGSSSVLELDVDGVRLAADGSDRGVDWTAGIDRTPSYGALGLVPHSGVPLDPARYAEYEALMQPGRSSSDTGFLARGESLAGVLAQDAAEVARLGVSHQLLSGLLQYVRGLLDLGVGRSRPVEVELGGQQLRVQVAAGFAGAVSSPISRAVAYRDYAVDNLSTGARLTFNGLLPELVARGFYEGSVPHRLEPGDILAVFAGTGTVPDLMSAARTLGIPTGDAPAYAPRTAPATPVGGALGELVRTTVRGQVRFDLRGLDTHTLPERDRFWPDLLAVLQRHRDEIDSVPLDGLDLSGLDLSGVLCVPFGHERYHSPDNARVTSMRGVNLRDADLSGADLEGLDLSGADLTGARLDGANLDGVDLADAVLVGTTLRGANLARTDLLRADLREADLRGAEIDDRTSVIGADLRGARLPRGRQADGLVAEAAFGPRETRPAALGQTASTVPVLSVLDAMARARYPELSAKQRSRLESVLARATDGEEIHLHVDAPTGRWRRPRHENVVVLIVGDPLQVVIPPNSSSPGTITPLSGSWFTSTQPEQTSDRPPQYRITRIAGPFPSTVARGDGRTRIDPTLPGDEESFGVSGDDRPGERAGRSGVAATAFEVAVGGTTWTVHQDPRVVEAFVDDFVRQQFPADVSPEMVDGVVAGLSRRGGRLRLVVGPDNRVVAAASLAAGPGARGAPRSWLEHAVVAPGAVGVAQDPQFWADVFGVPSSSIDIGAAAPEAQLQRLLQKLVGHDAAAHELLATPELAVLVHGSTTEEGREHELAAALEAVADDVPGLTLVARGEHTPDGAERWVPLAGNEPWPAWQLATDGMFGPAAPAADAGVLVAASEPAPPEPVRVASGDRTWLVHREVHGMQDAVASFLGTVLPSDVPADVLGGVVSDLLEVGSHGSDDAASGERRVVVVTTEAGDVVAVLAGVVDLVVGGAARHVRVERVFAGAWDAGGPPLFLADEFWAEAFGAPLVDLHGALPSARIEQELAWRRRSWVDGRVEIDYTEALEAWSADVLDTAPGRLVSDIGAAYPGVTLVMPGGAEAGGAPVRVPAAVAVDLVRATGGFPQLVRNGPDGWGATRPLDTWGTERSWGAETVRVITGTDQVMVHRDLVRDLVGSFVRDRLPAGVPEQVVQGAVTDLFGTDAAGPDRRVVVVRDPDGRVVAAGAARFTPGTVSERAGDVLRRLNPLAQRRIEQLIAGDGTATLEVAYVDPGATDAPHGPAFWAHTFQVPAIDAGAASPRRQVGQLLRALVGHGGADHEIVVTPDVVRLVELSTTGTGTGTSTGTGRADAVAGALQTVADAVPDLTLVVRGEHADDGKERWVPVQGNGAPQAWQLVTEAIPAGGRSTGTVEADGPTLPAFAPSSGDPAPERSSPPDLPVRGFTSFVEDDDPLAVAVARVAPLPGYHDVLVHSDGHAFSGRPTDAAADPRAARHGIRYLAERLRQDPAYLGGPVRLVADATSAPWSDLAAALADELGAPVLGATALVAARAGEAGSDPWVLEVRAVDGSAGYWQEHHPRSRPDRWSSIVDRLAELDPGILPRLRTVNATSVTDRTDDGSVPAPASHWANCEYATVTADAILAGRPASALPLPLPAPGQAPVDFFDTATLGRSTLAEDAFPGSQLTDRDGPDDVAELLMSYRRPGDGGVVYVQRTNGSTHVFNVVRLRDDVLFVDTTVRRMWLHSAPEVFSFTGEVVGSHDPSDWRRRYQVYKYLPTRPKPAGRMPPAGRPVPPALPADDESFGMSGESQPTGSPAEAQPEVPDQRGFTANVMAPLRVSDWDTFRSHLAEAKRIGVDAVSVDVWWGMVETDDKVFEWDYYDRMFATIVDAGLKVVPILSFHECGSNVGDAVQIPLPGWVWPKYEQRRLGGVRLDRDGLKHRSEYGNVSAETMQGWADPLVVGEYVAFARAFADRYGDRYDSEILEVNVSLGPAGELRYPAYNSHDSRYDDPLRPASATFSTDYPSRGALQAYSPLAVQSFREWALHKYDDIAGVNRAWRTELRTPEEIAPPADGEWFFGSGDHRDIQYGRDFFDWYNGSLVEHGRVVLAAALDALGDAFPSADFGFKVPGVHWTMGHPVWPNAAALAAGLMQSSIPWDDSTGHGYRNVVSLARHVQGLTRRLVVLHFTCLEMSNTNWAPQYSLAQDLVFWVAQLAERMGITIKGENALSGGVRSDSGWDNIVNAVEHAAYSGLTVLRVEDVVDGVGRRRYQQLIASHQVARPGYGLDDVRPSSEPSFGVPHGVEPELEMLEWGGWGGGELIGIGRPGQRVDVATTGLDDVSTGARLLGDGVFDGLPAAWSPLVPGIEAELSALVGWRWPADVPNLTEVNRLWDGVVIDTGGGVLVRAQLVPAGGATRAGRRAFFGRSTEIDDRAAPETTEVSFPYVETKSESARGVWHTTSLSAQARLGAHADGWPSLGGGFGLSAMRRSRRDVAVNNYTTSIAVTTGSGGRATFFGDAVLRLEVVGPGRDGDSAAGARPAPASVPVAATFRLPLELTRRPGEPLSDTIPLDGVLRSWHRRGWVPVVPVRQREVLSGLLAAEVLSFGSLLEDAGTALARQFLGSDVLPPGEAADALAGLVSQRNGERQVRDLGAGVYSVGARVPTAPSVSAAGGGPAPQSVQFRLTTRVLEARFIGVLPHGLVAMSKVRRMRGEGVAVEFGAGAKLSADLGTTTSGILESSSVTGSGAVSASSSGGVDSTSISGVFDADLTWERSQVAPSGPMARVQVSTRSEVAFVGAGQGQLLPPVTRDGTAVLLVPVSDLPAFMERLGSEPPSGGPASASVAPAALRAGAGLGGGVVDSMTGAVDILDTVLDLARQRLEDAGASHGGLRLADEEWQEIRLALATVFSPAGLTSRQRSLVQAGIWSQPVAVRADDGTMLHLTVAARARMHGREITSLPGLPTSGWEVGSDERRFRARQETRRAGRSLGGGLGGPGVSVRPSDGGIAASELLGSVGGTTTGVAVVGVGEGPWAGTNKGASVPGATDAFEVPVTFEVSARVTAMRQIDGDEPPGTDVAAAPEPVELPGSLRVQVPVGFTALEEPLPNDAGPMAPAPLAPHEWPLEVRAAEAVRDLVGEVAEAAMGASTPAARAGVAAAFEGALEYIGEQLDPEPMRIGLSRLLDRRDGVRVPFYDGVTLLGSIRVTAELLTTEGRGPVSAPDGVSMVLDDHHQAGRMVDTMLGRVGVVERRNGVGGGTDATNATESSIIGQRSEDQSVDLGVHQDSAHRYLEVHVDRVLRAVAQPVDIELRHLKVTATFTPAGQQRRMPSRSADRLLEDAVTLAVPRAEHPFRRLQRVPVWTPRAAGPDRPATTEEQRLLRAIGAGTALGAYAMPQGAFVDSVWAEVDALLRDHGMRYVVEGRSGTALRAVLTGDGWLSLLPHALAGSLTIPLPPEPRLHGVRRRWLSITASVPPGGASRLPGRLTAAEVTVQRVNERVDQDISRTFGLSGALTSHSSSVRSPGPLTGGVSLGAGHRVDRAVLDATASGRSPLMIHQSNTTFTSAHVVFDVPVDVRVELVTDDIGTTHLVPDVLVPTSLTPPALRSGFGPLIARAGAATAALLGPSATRTTTWTYRAAVAEPLLAAHLDPPSVEAPTGAPGAAATDASTRTGPLLSPGRTHQAGLVVHSIDPVAMGRARDVLVTELQSSDTDTGRWIRRSATTLSTIRTVLSPEVLSSLLDRLVTGEQVVIPVGTVGPRRTVTLEVAAQVGDLTPIGWIAGAQDNLALWMNASSTASIHIAEHGGAVSGNVGAFSPDASRAIRLSTALDPGVLPSDLSIRSRPGPLLLVSGDIALTATASLAVPGDPVSGRIAGNVVVRRAAILSLTADQADELGLTGDPGTGSSRVHLPGDEASFGSPTDPTPGDPPDGPDDVADLVLDPDDAITDGQLAEDLGSGFAVLGAVVGQGAFGTVHAISYVLDHPARRQVGAARVLKVPRSDLPADLLLEVTGDWGAHGVDDFAEEVAGIRLVAQSSPRLLHADPRLVRWADADGVGRFGISMSLVDAPLCWDVFHSGPDAPVPTGVGWEHVAGLREIQADLRAAGVDAVELAGFYAPGGDLIVIDALGVTRAPGEKMTGSLGLLLVGLADDLEARLGRQEPAPDPVDRSTDGLPFVGGPSLPVGTGAAVDDGLVWPSPVGVLRDTGERRGRRSAISVFEQVDDGRRWLFRRLDTFGR
ncbi:MAG: family 14 glycosylhydrolase, partial [Dermatophilaceae bacterium]